MWSATRMSCCMSHVLREIFGVRHGFNPGWKTLKVFWHLAFQCSSDISVCNCAGCHWLQHVQIVRPMICWICRCFRHWFCHCSAAGQFRAIRRGKEYLGSDSVLIVASGHVFPCRRPLWIQRTSCTSLIFGVVAITPSVARDPPIPWSPFAWKIVVWTRDDEGNNSWRNGWPVQRRFLDCSKLWALKLQPPRRSGFLIPSSIMKDGAWFALDRSNQKISFLWHDHDSPWQLMLADLGQGLCSFAAHVSSAFWCQGWPK